MTELIQEYLQKIPIYQLQKKYQVSYKKIIKILKENDVYIKYNTQSIEKEYIIQFIKDNYGKIPVQDLKSKLNISSSVLYKILKKENIPLLVSGTIIRPNIDNIDKSSKWFNYFIGWIESDGNIMFKKGVYSCTLSIKDEEIIDLFQNLIPGSKKYYFKDKNMYALKVNHKDFVNYFISIGITPKKSNNVEIRNYTFNNHFIRGVFDGDGSVRDITLSNKFEAKITSGSIVFVKQIVKYLKENNIHTSVYKNGKCFNITTTSKKETFKFYEFLYKDCDDLYLNRKYIKFKAMFND